MLDIDSPEEISAAAQQFTAAMDAAASQVAAATEQLSVPGPITSPLDRYLSTELATLHWALDHSAARTQAAAKLACGDAIRMATHIAAADVECGTTVHASSR